MRATGGGDDGFFTVAVAATLLAMCLIGAVLIQLSVRTANLVSRREQVLVSRYAAAALAERTLREIEVSGQPLQAWASVQRREVWTGQPVWATVLVQQTDETDTACLVQVAVGAATSGADAVLLAGVERDGLARAELAWELEADGAPRRRYLLGGRAAECLRN